jgi:hypothetical protein
MRDRERKKGGGGGGVKEDSNYQRWRINAFKGVGYKKKDVRLETRMLWCSIIGREEG